MACGIVCLREELRVELQETKPGVEDRIAPVKRAFLGVLAALAIPTGLTAAEHNLSETIERFESLRAGSRSAAVKDLHVTCGHLDLLLRSGNVAPIRAGEEIVGFFFQGTGSMIRAVCGKPTRF